MVAYYNENNPHAAQWLRSLIAAKQIAKGEVDQRSIKEVRADDLKGFAQCHFFAGIGGWSYALRLAGWPDDRSVWTASCPCQPYAYATNATGGSAGGADQRNLWPVFFSLVSQRRPAIIFGEQIPNAIKWGWWDRAALDLESQDYAVASLLLRADAAGAAHERKRLYWLADASGAGREGYQQPVEPCPVANGAAYAIDGDPFACARRALAGDYSDLLPRHGLSVGMERLAARAYGNAIVPQVAAQFIRASCIPPRQEPPPGNLF